MKRMVIIGGGVVGCAIANALANSNTEIHLIEKNAKVGEGVTSRNSEVIHAGLYYKPGSLKAKLCIEGQALLYEWCAHKSIPHQRLGKLVVAQEGEDAGLEALIQNAIACGVSPKSLIIISKTELKNTYPNIKGGSAVHSSNSGIVDSQALCHSLYVAASKKEVTFHLACEVKGITKMSDGYQVQSSRGDIDCDVVINAAGLYADDIAKMVGVNKYTIYPWRGDYFKINLPYTISKLIYPLKRPRSKSLGIHLRIDTAGRTFLGPDIEPWTSKEDFSDRPEKRDKFYEAASRLFVDIKPEMLTYDTCGIRPKLRPFDSKDERDFVISEDLPDFINLVGIESPGLTSALAIARYVKTIVSGCHPPA